MCCLPHFFLRYFFSLSASAEVISLNGKNTRAEHYYRPTSDGDYDWVDGSGSFNMRVSWSGVAWAGFTYSDVNDTTTSGYTNQYAVYGNGRDYSGSGVYAVGYVDNYNGYHPTLSFSSPQRVNGLYLNNTTYAALSMRDGDQFAKAFSTNDWFKLTVQAYDSSGTGLGTTDFFLAYFALDHVETVPEPSVMALSSMALGLLLFARRYFLL